MPPPTNGDLPMNVERIEQLKIEINWLAQQGKVAATMKDLQRSREFMLRVVPLVSQLAVLTNDPSYKKLAESGRKLCENFNRRDH